MPIFFYHHHKQYLSLTLLFCIIPFLIKGSLLLTKNNITKMKWYEIEDLLTSGTIKGYYDTNEVLEYINSLVQNFEEIVLPIKTIGKTIEGNDIYAIGLTLKNQTNKQNQDKTSKDYPKEQVLFTGMWHGNEPTSTSMILYLITYLIHGYFHLNEYALYLLNTKEIWFIPMLNIDAFNYVSKVYHEISETIIVYKNRRNSTINLCGKSGIGVDLTRNFDFKFNDPDIIKGYPKDYNPTSDIYYPCKPFYKGDSPHSEPETLALLNLINSMNFTLVINLMGQIGVKWLLIYQLPDYHVKAPLNPNLQIYIYYDKQRAGNYFMIPNIDNDSQNSSSIFKKIYSQILPEATFPKGIKYGNKFDIMNETQNGDIVDYLLNVKHILSANYKLGLPNNYLIQGFLDKSNLLRLYWENYNALLYLIQKTGDYIKLVSVENDLCSTNNSKLSCFDHETSPKTIFYFYKLNLSNTGINPKIGIKDSTTQIPLNTSLIFNYPINQNLKIYKIFLEYTNSTGGIISQPIQISHNETQNDHALIKAPINISFANQVVNIRLILSGSASQVSIKDQIFNITVEGFSNIPSANLNICIKNHKLHQDSLNEDLSHKLEKMKNIFILLFTIGLVLIITYYLFYSKFHSNQLRDNKKKLSNIDNTKSNNTKYKVHPVDTNEDVENNMDSTLQKTNNKESSSSSKKNKKEYSRVKLKKEKDSSSDEENQTLKI